MEEGGEVKCAADEEEYQNGHLPIAVAAAAVAVDVTMLFRDRDRRIGDPMGIGAIALVVESK